MAVVKASVDLATLSHDSIALALLHYGRRTLQPARTDGPTEAVAAATVVKLHNGYSGCNYRVQTTSLRHGQHGADEQDEVRTCTMDSVWTVPRGRCPDSVCICRIILSPR
jgi:hypothetical protein